MARNVGKTYKQKNKNYGIDLGNSSKLEPTSPIHPINDDGAQYASSISSYFGATSITMDGNGQGDRDLLKRYRTMSTYEQIDMAIDAIVNEAIVYDSTTYPVSLNLDKLPLSKTIKMKIFEEFNNVLKLLEFDQKSYTVFRRWYIDGRIYYNVIIDTQHPENGIIELRPVEAMKIKKVNPMFYKRVHG